MSGNVQIVLLTIFGVIGAAVITMIGTAINDVAGIEVVPNPALEQEGIIVNPTVELPSSIDEQDTYPKIYLINENTENPEKISCPANLVEVQTQIMEEDRLSSVMSKLATYQPNSNDLVNQFNDQNLQLISTIVTDRVGIIVFTGQILKDDVCSLLRLEAQIKATATQFENIDAVQIYINDQLFEDRISDLL
jgi:hypothetical protein